MNMKKFNRGLLVFCAVLFLFYEFNESLFGPSVSVALQMPDKYINCPDEEIKEEETGKTEEAVILTAAEAVEECYVPYYILPKEEDVGILAIALTKEPEEIKPEITGKPVKTSDVVSTGIDDEALYDEFYIPVYQCGFSGDIQVLDFDIQRYLYKCLKERGIGWWYPYALAQGYGESRYQTDQITNGLDYGLWQFRILYWDERAAAAGLPGADPLNPYEETYVYAHFISQKLQESGGDITGALKRYYDSNDDAVDAQYAAYILQYVPTLVEIKE